MSLTKELEYWPEGILAARIPANNNVRTIQALVLSSALSATTAAQPSTPNDLDVYILPASPTGTQWSGFSEGDIVIFYMDTWTAFAPYEGLRKCVLDEGTDGEDWQYLGGSWATAAGGSGSGGATVGVQYVAETGSTADSDPGPGLLKWNNATQASATVLFLDDDTSDGVSLTSWWTALDSGGFCYLQHATVQDTWQIWEITTVTDATGYVKLAVTLIANGGSFADGDPMLITLEQGQIAPPASRDTVSTLATSGSVAINFALGDYFTLALAGNVSGFTFSNLPGSGKGGSLVIQITQDTTSRTVAWPASFKWAGGVPSPVSTASGAKDLLAITTHDNGTTWNATLAKAFA